MYVPTHTITETYYKCTSIPVVCVYTHTVLYVSLSLFVSVFELTRVDISTDITYMYTVLPLDHARCAISLTSTHQRLSLSTLTSKSHR